jgi:hypothetical protein
LRPSDARKNLQRSSVRRQMQKPSSVERFHVYPPKKCVKGKKRTPWTGYK